MTYMLDTDMCSYIMRDRADWGTQQADTFATTRAKVFRAGAPIGFTDTMIAAHALTIDAVLVSNNVRHFAKVPGLSIENWLAT